MMRHGWCRPHSFSKRGTRKEVPARLSPRPKEKSNTKPKRERRNEMDYKIMSAVYYRDVQLTQYEYCVLMTLACAAKDDKSLAAPSLKRIADRSGMSVRQVSRTVATLSERGLLSVSKRQTASGQWCNLYHVHTDKFGTQKPIDESEYKSGSESNMDSQSNMDGSTKSGEGVQRVAKSGSESNYNNIVNNIDNNINNNKTDKTVDSGVKGGQGGTKPTQTPSDKTSQVVCRSDVIVVSLRDIGSSALHTLISEGMPEEEVKSRLRAVWETFKAKANNIRATGRTDRGKRVNDPLRFLSGMLCNMAREYTPAEPHHEPDSLEEIFNLLLAEYKEIYPEVADRIGGITLDDLPAPMANKLRAKEREKWGDIDKRVKWVKSGIDGWMYGWVQRARENEQTELANSIRRWEDKLAKLRFAPEGYYDPHKSVTEAIADLEGKIARARDTLTRLSAA